MPYIIDVQSTKRFPAPLLRDVAAAANEAMTHQAVSDGAGLTILLTEDDYIRALNLQYRGEDSATDVLSFPAGEPMPGSENLLEYLGDIAISVPTAERQSSAKGHSLGAELQLLTIHGVLHLLGFDHILAGERAMMWSIQAAILRSLGLESIQPSEDESHA